VSEDIDSWQAFVNVETNREVKYLFSVFGDSFSRIFLMHQNTELIKILTRDFLFIIHASQESETEAPKLKTPKCDKVLLA
jgi:hypothetical protein